MGRQITSGNSLLSLLIKMRYFFIALGLFFIAVWFFLFNAFEESKALALRYENNGVTVPGVIKGTRVEYRTGGERTFTITRGRSVTQTNWVGYTYSDANGGKHEGSAPHHFTDFSKLVAGDTIQVIYLKDAPDMSRTVRFQAYTREASFIPESFFFFLMGGVPLLLGLYQIQCHRRNDYKHR
jgi:hypothetical protein